MFKGKVYFEDGNIEYVVVSAYWDAEAEQIVHDEYGNDNAVVAIEWERISDAPAMVEVPFDVYEMLEY